MTVIKLNPTLPKNALPELLPVTLWNDLGGHHMALVEFTVSERTEAADEDSELSAKLAVTSIEFARGTGDTEVLRQALRARYDARTSVGTLTEGQDFNLSLDALLPDGDASLPEGVSSVTFTNGRTGKTETVTRTP